jgi:hypothetical protein
MCLSDIQVLTAEDVLKKPALPRWEPPVTGLPLFEPEKNLKDSPDYHEEPVYEYSNYLRLMEGNLFFFRLIFFSKSMQTSH